MLHGLVPLSRDRAGRGPGGEDGSGAVEPVTGGGVDDDRLDLAFGSRAGAHAGLVEVVDTAGASEFVRGRPPPIRVAMFGQLRPDLTDRAVMVERSTSKQAASTSCVVECRRCTSVTSSRSTNRACAWYRPERSLSRTEPSSLPVRRECSSSRQDPQCARRVQSRTKLTRGEMSVL